MLCMIIALVMVMTLIPRLPAGLAYAAVGDDAPASNKQLIDNGDGTYTLALSVTGATQSSSTTQVTKANVVLVLDTSSSMVNNSSGETTPYTYTEYNGTSNNPQKWGVDEEGEYISVYYRNGSWRIRNQNNAPAYNGTVYSREGGEAISRLDAEKDALTKENGIIDNLLSQNVPGDPVKSDIIEVAVVSFGRGGEIVQSFTNSSTTLKTTINGLTTSTGTNWEEGLMRADELADSIRAAQPNEDVFVIFLTDGQPTTHYNDYSVGYDTNAEWVAARDDARGLVTDGDKFYALFTWGSATYSPYLASLVQYAYTGTGNSNTQLQPAYAQYFTDATDTDALINALNQIVHDITTGVGYTNVELTDGVTEMTTSNVKVSPGGDVTGLKYYRSGGPYSTTANNGLGEEWTDAPHATINNKGEVDWDLGSLILENGVTYTISFIVWPSQESLDLVADLNNGVVSYDSLTADQKSQIFVSGGQYSLKTNTDYPSVTYSTVTTTTVDGETTTVVSDPQTATIVNPEPVGLAEEKLNAKKEWEDTLDPSQREEVGESVTLYLMVDGHYYYTDPDTGEPLGVVLEEDSNWTETGYLAIAPGLMVNNESPAYPGDDVEGVTYVEWEGVKYAILEKGHDYVWHESDINNHFELTSYTHHPMIMGHDANNEPIIKDVVFEEDAQGNILSIISVEEMSDTLSATNTLKGGINITKKVVDEEGVEVDDLNPFTITVTVTDPDGNALPTKTVTNSEDPQYGTEYTIDYRIYYGPNNPNYVAGAAQNRSDHIYKTGTSFEETIYVGDTIRVVNVEDDSLYTVTETVPTGYDPDYIVDYSINYAGEDPAPFPEGTAPSVQGNSASYAEITNTYTYGELEVTKTVEVTKGDEEQAKAKEFEFTFKLYADDTKATELTGNKYNYTITKADGTTSTGTITEGGTFTLKDGEKINIEKLPETAYYEVIETAKDGYTTTKTGDVGTIVAKETAEAEFTNTYDLTPTTVSFPVTKEIEVPTGLTEPTDWSFTFTVAANNGAPTTTTMEKTVTKAAPTATFGDFTFTEPGTYTYTVTETGTATYFTNDEAATTGKTVTVTVVDNGDGTMTATASSTEASPLKFTNTYNPGPTTAQIPVVKNILSDADVNDITGKFTFTLAAGTNTAGVETPMPSPNTIVCGADGVEVQFGSVTYTKPGTYNYTVAESVTGNPDADSVDGIGLETKAPKNVQVVVTDDGTGTLKAVVNGGLTVEFNNPYTVEEIPVYIPVEKILNVPEGLTAPDITGKFTFALTAGSNTAAGNIPTPVPTTTRYTNPDADGGDITFGPITFAAPGEYNYTITETGSADGVTNDSQTTQTVKVTIVDNGDGSFTATFDKENIQFVNKYDVESITASIPVEKILNVGAGLNAPDITDEFTFELTAAEGTPMPTVTSYTNPDADGGDMSFGEITYTKPGTYTYTVTETGTVDGVSAVGTTTKTVEVVVSDSAANGKMTVTVNGGEKLTFTNEYKVNETTAVIPVNKILEVPAGLTPGDITDKFTFTLAAGTNTAAGDIATPMPETTSYTNPDPNGGKVTFGSEDDPITFTAPGTYTYTITESGSADGVTNDTEATKTITIVVTDKGDGNLEAVVNGGKDVEFTNTYNVEPTTVSFPAKKELAVPAGTTGPDITRKYDIILTAGENTAGEGVVTPMPEVTSYKNPDSDGGVVTFGTITYTKPGTYNYTVSEDGTVSGVSNDLAAGGKTVTVTVVDNGNGTMTATADSTETSPVTFINTYSYGTIKAQPSVNKNLSFADGLNPPDITGEYTFTLAADNAKNAEGVESPMPAEGGETVTNPGARGGTVSFGEITFNAPGTYNYKVTESGSVDGVTNDTANPKEFNIVVTDNLDGTLSYVINYNNDTGHVQFTNTYEVEPTTAEFPVKKFISVPAGMTGPSTWSYDIAVAVAENSPEGTPVATSMTDTVTNTADTATFGPFTYNKPGEYFYTVTESGTVPGVTNETGSKTVKVTVVDNRDGTMTATADSTAASPVTFTNTYNVEPTTVEFPVEKIMTVPAGMAGPANWSYTINVAVAEGSPEGTPVAETMTGTVTKAVPKTTFGDFTYTVPGTYTYTVSETKVGEISGVTDDEDAAGKTVTVEVVDNGNGTMTATASSTDETPLQFNNSYNVKPVQISFPVKKIMSVPAGLKGPKEWSYSIKVAAVDGAPVAETMTGTVTNTADTATFGPFSYNAPGEYKYTVTESGTIAGVDNDEAATTGKTVTVTVTDNGDGSLSVSADSTAASPVTFTNTYEVEPTTASFPVEKIMSVPAGMDGPADWSYTINVAVAEGSPTGTPVAETMTGRVTKATPTTTFGDFTYTAPGTYTYTVSETKVGEISGVTDDEDAAGKTVTVTVVDNQNGTLTATADSTTEEPLQFTNNYNVEPTTAKIPVEKILEVPEGLTAPDIKNKFTFELAAGDNTAAGDIDTPMPTVTSYTNPDKTGGTVSFGDITYTAPGSYTYTVTETGEVKGVSNDSVGTKTVTVNVVDNKDGTMTATVNGGQTLKFVNSYNVGETTAVIPVVKILEVPEGLDGPDDITEEFTFTLTAGTNTAAGGIDTPMPKDAEGNVVSEIKNPAADGGSAQFATITFAKPGTYNYNITETGEVDGVTNDKNASQDIQIVVVDNSDGTLTATVNKGQEVKFTNTYGVEPTTAKFPVDKNMVVPEGLDGPKDWKYDIKVVAQNGAPVAKVMEGTVTKAAPSVTFGDFTYDMPGEYKYTVSETGTYPGVENDKDAAGKTVTVTVVDNKDGTLTATPNYSEDEPLVFTNTYSVDPTKANFPVEKILEVPEGLDPDSIEGKFTFTLTAAEGTPMPKVTEQTNPSKDGGTVTFGDIEYALPGTYNYTVTESGSAPGVTNDATASKPVKVEVVDNGDGTLTATPDYDKDNPLQFTNKYSVEPTTAEFPVKKIMEVPEELDGPETWTYEITVEAQKGAPEAETMTGEVTEKADTATFGDFTYTKPGTYEYKVTETGDIKGVTNDKEATKTVTVTVVDNGDGTLTATADSTTDKPLTFTNKYSADPVEVETKAKLKKVVKSMPPKAKSVDFEFTLQEEGSEEVLKATVTATETGEYGIDFGALKFTKPGTHTYTLTEVLDNLDGGWVVEKSPAKITIKVTDNKAGQLVAEADSADIINTFDTVEITGEKVWDDAEYFDEDGKALNGYERPDVTINLMADGKKVDSVKVTAKDDWKFTFTDLPKYKDHGTEIVYSVTEEPVDGYDAAVDGTTVTNTPFEKKDILNPTFLTIFKVDVDGNDVGLAGAEFTLSGDALDEDVVYTTGEDGTVKIDIEKDGSYTLTETKAPEGYEIPDDATYTIEVEKEFVKVELDKDKNVWNWIYDLIFGEDSSVFDRDAMRLTVEDPSEKISVTAEKIWNDEDDKDGLRPDKITLTITGWAGDEEVYSDMVKVKENEDGDWTYTWEDLNKYCDGEEIVYEVSEKKVADYKTKIGKMKETSDGYKVKITNTHKPKKTPKTGDTTQVLPYMLMFTTALLGLLLALRRKEQKK